MPDLESMLAITASLGAALIILRRIANPPMSKDEGCRYFLTNLEKDLDREVSRVESFPGMVGSRKHEELKLALIRLQELNSRRTVYRRDVMPVFEACRTYGIGYFGSEE